MLEIKVTIEATALTNAINNLATAISGNKNEQIATVWCKTTPAPTTAPTQPTAAPTQPSVPVAQPTATPPQAPAPATVPTAAQPNFPAPSVPLAQPPQYTVEQIMAAGATLMDAGKVNELIALLHSFGVQAVMDLKPEQLGAFATEMRKLGAKI